MEGDEIVYPCTPKLKNRFLEKVGSITPAGLKTPGVNIPPTPYLTKLGFGTGVCVYLYQRSPRAGIAVSPWAVKRVNKRHENTEFSNRLEEEAKVLRTLSHPHIIGFRGFKKTVSGPRDLIMEDGHRSLNDLIESRKEELDLPFPANSIEKVIRDGSEALDYLHTEKLIMHGDLKSANILVVGDFENIKLCDFGVTLPLDKEGRVCDPSKRYVGTDAWSPMEAIKNLPITSKTDIFAFGLTLFEMLALHPPHIDKLMGDTTDESFNTSMDGSMDDSLDESVDDTAYREALGHRPALPDHLQLDSEYVKVLEIFFASTIEEPKSRPSAKQILEILDREEQDDSVLCVNMVEGPAAL